jgi:heme/copper-type cytochrome/quinol oxidase subunit 3
VKRRVIDVSRLPTMAFGAKDPLWWSVMCLIAIEGTMLVLLALSYLYVSDRTHPFPPTHYTKLVAILSTVEVVLWILAGIPQQLSSRAAVRGDLKRMRLYLVLATLIGIVATVLRIWVFKELPFRWNDHAYGSVVWGMLGVQFTHCATGVLEDAIFCVILFVGPVEEKHRTDINVTTPLMWFVTAGALLCWAIIFLPVLLGGGR